MLYNLIVCYSMFPVLAATTPILDTSLNNQDLVLKPHHRIEQRQTVVSSVPSEITALNEISALQKYMDSEPNITPQKSYDYLSARLKKLGFEDKPTAREIFYTILSFLRMQPNIMNADDLRNQVNDLTSELNFLYGKQQQDFLNWTSHLQKLLNPNTFIHLDHKQMAHCIDIFDRLHNTVEATSSVINDPNGEGANLFDPNLFLKKESDNAKAIYSWITDLEKMAANFSENFDKLSTKELEEQISAANEFINNLKQQAIVIDDKEIAISRNSRKHLQNIARSAIRVLTNRKAEISAEA